MIFLSTETISSFFSIILRILRMKRSRPKVIIATGLCLILCIIWFISIVIESIRHQKLVEEIISIRTNNYSISEDDIHIGSRLIKNLILTRSNHSFIIFNFLFKNSGSLVYFVLFLRHRKIF